MTYLPGPATAALIAMLDARTEAHEEYEQHHATLVAYLLSAVQRADWRAVSDAANDLRVLEAKR